MLLNNPVRDIMWVANGIVKRCFVPYGTECHTYRWTFYPDDVPKAQINLLRYILLVWKYIFHHKEPISCPSFATRGIWFWVCNSNKKALNTQDQKPLPCIHSRYSPGQAGTGSCKRGVALGLGLPPSLLVERGRASQTSAWAQSNDAMGWVKVFKKYDLFLSLISSILQF